MRPVVGITAAVEEVSYGPWRDVPAALVPMSYARSVRHAGGRPVLLVPDDAEDQNNALDLLDALIISGGAGDLDPALYGQERHPETGPVNPERDAYELALVKGAIETRLPTLGVCRGMEVINVAYGGSLEQHLPDVVGHEKHRERGTFVDHDARMAEESLAARATGSKLEVVKSCHHQGIKEVGAGLLATGWATMDDSIEAVEDPELEFMLGVLWHPEEDEKSRLIRTLVKEV
ncbi:MAG: gamma-glutamyl-gamma-aminobutyrate hydrolase family protein [Rubrobacteraceae bacterium]